MVGTLRFLVRFEPSGRKFFELQRHRNSEATLPYLRTRICRRRELSPGTAGEAEKIQRGELAIFHSCASLSSVRFGSIPLKTIRLPRNGRKQCDFNQFFSVRFVDIPLSWPIFLVGFRVTEFFNRIGRKRTRIGFKWPCVELTQPWH